MVFKKGYKQSQKQKENKKYLRPHRKGEFKHSEETKRKMSSSRIGKQKGKKNGFWKGNNVGNIGLHRWLRKNKPKSKSCEFCGKNKDLELANINGIYNRDFANYKWLCIKCHRNFDFPKGIGKNHKLNLKTLP